MLRPRLARQFQGHMRVAIISVFGGTVHELSVNLNGEGPLPAWFVALEPPASSNQAQDQQQNDGADGGVDDFRNQPAAEMNADLREQQARNQRAGDADHNIADDAKAGAADDLAREPAGHQADEQDDENAFVGKYH